METVTFPSGRRVAKFSPEPEHLRHRDPQHALYRFIEAPHELTDGLVADELAGHLDRLNLALSDLAGTIGSVEKQVEDLRPEKRAERLAAAVVEPVARVAQVCRRDIADQRRQLASAEDLVLAYTRPASPEELPEVIRATARQTWQWDRLLETPEAERMALLHRDGGQSWLHAAISCPLPVLEPEVLDELRRELALEAEPWLGDLVRFRHKVLDAVANLTASVYRFVGDSLERLGQAHGLRYSLAGLEAFADSEAGAEVLSTWAPEPARVASA